jgi:hypothetical protein
MPGVAAAAGVLPVIGVRCDRPISAPPKVSCSPPKYQLSMAQRSFHMGLRARPL